MAGWQLAVRVILRVYVDVQVTMTEANDLILRVDTIELYQVSE